MAVIEAMTAAHAGAVLAIYQAGLDSGDASFETKAPDWAAFDAARLPGHRYVARDPGSGEVLGWIAVSAVSARRVYAGVVEHSVYVHPAARAAASAGPCSRRSSPRPRRPGSGPSSRPSSPRTPPACGCTPARGSAWWAPGSGSAGITAGGGTSS